MFNKQRIIDLQNEIFWLRADYKILREDHYKLSEHLYFLMEKLGYTVRNYSSNGVVEKIEKE